MRRCIGGLVGFTVLTLVPAACSGSGHPATAAPLTYRWRGGVVVSLSGVGTIAFGTEEGKATTALVAALGRPDLSVPTGTGGEGGCVGKPHSSLGWGNFGVTFLEGKLAAWQLVDPAPATTKLAVQDLAPGDGVHLGDRHPEFRLGAANAAVVQLYGFEFAHNAAAQSRAAVDSNGIVYQITTVAMGIGDCLLID